MGIHRESRVNRLSMIDPRFLMSCSWVAVSFVVADGGFFGLIFNNVQENRWKCLNTSYTYRDKAKIPKVEAKQKVSQKSLIWHV